MNDNLNLEHDNVKNLLTDVIAQAKKMGAGEVDTSVAFNKGFMVDVRKDNVENIEYDRSKSLDITIYNGKKRGSASTNNFSQESIKQTIAGDAIPKHNLSALSRS